MRGVSLFYHILLKSTQQIKKKLGSKLAFFNCMRKCGKLNRFTPAVKRFSEGYFKTVQFLESSLFIRRIICGALIGDIVRSPSKPVNNSNMLSEFFWNKERGNGEIFVMRFRKVKGFFI